jgi:hypothetical protein
MAYQVGSQTEATAKLFTVTVVIGLVIALLGGWLAASQPVASISQDDLTKNLESLSSYAAEGSFLSDQYIKQRSTANFTAVSALKLQVAVSDLAQQLQDEQSASDVTGSVQKTINYADELSKDLAQLSLLPQNGESRHLNSQLHTLQDQIKSMADDQ